jgi:hypothetical protein
MDGPDMEIEIDNPEEVKIRMGDIEIDMEPKEDTEDDFNDNLAENLDDSQLQSLGSELVDDLEKDQIDRKEWMQTYVEGLKLLGLKNEERTEPWPGACGVYHPLLTEASRAASKSEGNHGDIPGRRSCQDCTSWAKTTLKRESRLRSTCPRRHELPAHRGHGRVPP